MDSKPLIEVKNLKKYFPLGKKQILHAVDDISFAIPSGQTLGLVGESGCGKTTLGRTLMRLYDADAGHILFEGEDIARASRNKKSELTRKMQMIFQDPYASLNPFFTVGEIVAEGLEVHGLYRNKDERRERTVQLLEMVGLHREHANRFPHEFSGGQRQRVGIARALAVDPSFIVCDEATSALDVSVQAQIINLLLDLQQQFGLTYLFIAHDLSMVRYISHQTAVMYLGTIVEMGATDDVYDHPLHPYTKALLDAVPIADPKVEQARAGTVIEGEVASPINPEPGCRFYARCSFATEICKQERPGLREVRPNHQVACHHV